MEPSTPSWWGLAAAHVCSDTYQVTVLPKGAKTPTDAERYAFSADDMVGAQLHWKQPHLLEIVYKKARINDFRNISYPFAKFGDQASWEYKVEIRLAPSSEGFLTWRVPLNNRNDPVAESE